jgi:hypothetical protein
MLDWSGAKSIMGNQEADDYPDHQSYHRLLGIII